MHRHCRRIRNKMGLNIGVQLESCKERQCFQGTSRFVHDTVKVMKVCYCLFRDIRIISISQWKKQNNGENNTATYISDTGGFTQYLPITYNVQVIIMSKTKYSVCVFKRIKTFVNLVRAISQTNLKNIFQLSFFLNIQKKRHLNYWWLLCVKG